MNTELSPELGIGIASAMGVGVIAVSNNLDITYYNKAILDLLDFRDIQGNQMPSYEKLFYVMASRGDFGAVDIETFSENHLQQFRNYLSGLEADLPLEFSPPNGRTLKAHTYRSHDGSGIIAFEDISEIRRKEEALRIALKLGKAGYWERNLDTGQLKIYSQYMASMLTQKERVAVESNGFDVITHHDDLEASKLQWENAVKNQVSYTATTRYKTETNGILWVKSNAQPQFSNTGRLTSYICYFEDVSEELRLQDDLRSAKETAERTLQAQNNFLARLAHEIRTPMNAVVGITDSIIQDNSAPNISSKLELIQSSADSIMNILEGTLNNSKLDADKLHLDPKPNDPVKTVKSICELWLPQAKKNNTNLNLRISRNIPSEVIFDRFRYEQCLNNLMSNAIKFTSNGVIDVILNIHNNKLVLAVKDTGIGMTQEQQNRIFDAFTQADHTISSRFGGTGLGMSITKKITEMMNGTIQVQSETGKGSVFVISLPLELVSTEEEVSLVDHILDVETETETFSYKNLNILVADDNKTNQIVVQSLLESRVGKIYFADNGQEVLDQLKIQDVDLVLMDIHMPVMDGIEATLAIRNSQEEWKDITVIALTADPQYQQLRLCKNIGMDGTIGKPVKLSSILEAIDQTMNPEQLSTSEAQLKTA